MAEDFFRLAKSRRSAVVARWTRLRALSPIKANFRRRAGLASAAKSAEARSSGPRVTPGKKI